MDFRKKALSNLRKNLRSSEEELPVEKVTVAADSKEGLEEGLEKAKDLMQSGAIDEMAEQAEDGAEEFESMMSDDDDHEEKDYSDEALAMMSREELMDCIRKMRDSEEEY